MMQVSRSLYRSLLRLCPSDLRRQYGAEMEEMFLASLAKARGATKIGVWSRAIADVMRHGVGARQDTWHRFSKTSAYVE
jgi:hypothetical protein